MTNAPKDLSQRAHRRLIGVLGILLPVLLYVVAGLRPVDGLPSWVPLPSVSAYYYTGAVAIFVGVLFSLSLFLFTYRGYEGVRADRVVGIVGGAAALGVSLFPTSPPDAVTEPPWWNFWIEAVHYVSAVVLFACFILFATWLFRKSSVAKADRPLEKRRRDAVSLACGIVMIVCVLWAAASAIARAPILLPEAIAIVAFAISWLVKGEAYLPIVRAIRRLAGARVE
jgi:hypothetical protein